MGWADWMVVEQSLEEELQLERNVRDVQAATDEEALKAFCVSLLRTNWHQAKLLKQAVGHIAERDAWDEASAA